MAVPADDVHMPAINLTTNITHPAEGGLVLIVRPVWKPRLPVCTDTCCLT